jgi:hypothetical protein
VVEAMPKRIGWLVCALIVAGCVTIEEPVPVGKDTYMISLGARGGFSTNAQLLTATIKNAGQFCAAKGLNIDVLSTRSGGVQMWTPQENQVVFRCRSDAD